MARVSLRRKAARRANAIVPVSALPRSSVVELEMLTRRKRTASTGAGAERDRDLRDARDRFVV